ncbi:MAG: 1-phosphofructokinase, partial [Actinomycetota bacterium]|nr:1-phosphofructokinase [Actinomycetota bacterium]
VAYGAASAALPGSAVPTPEQVTALAVDVEVTTARTVGLPSSTTAPPVTWSTTVPAAGRDVR